MKPGRNDPSYPILITGLELTQLKEQTWAMAEAFGLDRRIENYQGTRPITFRSWDLDCPDAVIFSALEDRSEYPALAGPGHDAMVNLLRRLEELRKRVDSQHRGG